MSFVVRMEAGSYLEREIYYVVHVSAIWRAPFWWVNRKISADVLARSHTQYTDQSLEQRSRREAKRLAFNHSVVSRRTIADCEIEYGNGF